MDSGKEKFMQNMDFKLKGKLVNINAEDLKDCTPKEDINDEELRGTMPRIKVMTKEELFEMVKDNPNYKVFQFIEGMTKNMPTVRLVLPDIEKDNPEDKFCLIRFEEGTPVDSTKLLKLLKEHNIKPRWSLPFIPVLGVEISKEVSFADLLSLMTTVKGFKKIREVEKFHEYSFMEI